MSSSDTTAIAAASDAAEKAELYSSILDEIDDARGRIKELIKEMRSSGHDVKAFKDAVNIKRRRNAEEIESRESLRDVYREAIGA